MRITGPTLHDWASAEFVRLVRHLLVFERGHGLGLLPGVPPGWFEPGSAIHVERTTTRFGRITLDVRASAETLEVRVVRRQAGPPGAVTATLHLPGRFTGDVRVNGTPVEGPPSVLLDLMDDAEIQVVVRA
ncbi:hypothetical protein OHA25_40770 [Nonomuraea sp. NBC_00507]|uniref:hypothetical protein n=1 Tax=Nonomuraea sp. NBC_00507 TaxID=2976002 RepID=UPI002E1959F8